MNVGNTPSRSIKASLSPLRARKVDASNSTVRSNLARNPVENICINDPDKIASFMIESGGEVLYYCEKCAILLASQGFAVVRCQQQESYENS